MKDRLLITQHIHTPLPLIPPCTSSKDIKVKPTHSGNFASASCLIEIETFIKPEGESDVTLDWREFTSSSGSTESA